LVGQESSEKTVDSKSLADVKIFKSSYHGLSTSETSQIITHGKDDPITKIDAKFSTLFIHWNPHAIMNLFQFKDDVSVFIEKVNTNLISDTPEVALSSPCENKLLILNAEMEAFEIFLNSAKDDLPLFVMKMCDAKVKFHSSKKKADENMIASVSVGDFRLEAAKTSRILDNYCTILGLSPNHSNSLLCFEYGKGSIAVDNCNISNIDRQKTEAYTNVTLSPMRFVHVQSQVFTLVEYLTEGVLGAIAKSLASSATQAAIEMNQIETVGEKVFIIKASGFDFVLPQAAYTPDHFFLHVGNMAVRFKALPTPGEGVADVVLDDVIMKCNREESIIENPIRMMIDVKLAPLNAPTVDDLATRVAISISRAEFILTNYHYAQVMKTLELNIGEIDSFLRDEDTHVSLSEPDGKVHRSKMNMPLLTLTHGGVEENIIKKRMYITLKFKALCLDLCNETGVEPILSLAAVKTTIQIKLFPDTETTEADVTMHDLVVEDRRLVAMNRYFKKLIRQVVSDGTDVFKLKYFQSKKDNTLNVDFELGSPQVVFIPDLAAEAIAFFKRDSPPTTIQVSIDEGSSNSFGIHALEQVSSKAYQEEFKGETKTTTCTLKTADCRLVFIDMGTSTSSYSSSSSKSTESFIFQGNTEAKAQFVSDLSSGVMLKSNVEIHGERLEIYTAEGENSLQPVQVLNPIRFSAFLSTNTKKNQQLVDLSFVTLSPVTVTLSMQNYALMMAIVTSTSEAWEANTFNGSIIDPVQEEKASSSGEIEKIRNIASELEKTDIETGSAEIEVMMRGNSTVASHSSHVSTPNYRKRIISAKTTLPETTLVVINDLQGLDEALFKVTMQSCVWGADVSVDETKKDNTIFHVHTNTNILADYFDSNTKLWEPFLLKPWEIDIKASRGKKQGSKRMMTTLDVESHPCQVSFSEQLLISLRGASSMWSLYSKTSKKALDILDDINASMNGSRKSLFPFMKAKASFSARAMTTTMPYGVENRSGYTIIFDVNGKKQQSPDGTTTLFSFPPSQGDGIGGCRTYGQDTTYKKQVDVLVDDQCIRIAHLDDEINQPMKAHQLGNNRTIFMNVIKTGKATIIYVTSFINLYNETSLDFSVSMKVENSFQPIGICAAQKSSSILRATKTGDMKSKGTVIGIPTALLHSAYHSHDLTGDNVSLQISHDSKTNIIGEIQLPPLKSFNKIATSKSPMKHFEVVCSSATQNKNATPERMVLKICCLVEIVDGYPFVKLFLQPRVTLVNNMLINILAKTSMPQTYLKGVEGELDLVRGGVIHRLEPLHSLEIYSPGHFVSFSFKFADNPVGDVRAGWSKPGSIDIPLGIRNCMESRLDCCFPFVTASGEDSKFGGGCEFFVSEISDTEESLPDEITSNSSSSSRTVALCIENLGVDHTSNFLFESCDVKSQPYTLSSFSSQLHQRRISLLPASNKLLRMLHLPTGRRTLPFSINDIALASGGIESTSIKWNDKTESGFCAYKMISDHNQLQHTSNNLLELHIIPSIIIYNGGHLKVRIVDASGNELIVDKGKFSCLQQSLEETGVTILIDFIEIGCATSPLRINKTGLQVTVVKSTPTGSIIGSMAIQTIIGAKDSRYVIKLGPLKDGNVANVKDSPSHSLLENDCLRFRVRWSQMEVTFLDTSKKNNSVSDRNEISQKTLSNDSVKKSTSYAKVAHMILNRFTVDYQKAFKDNTVSISRTSEKCARSQFAMIIKGLHLIDCTTALGGTTVIASTSKETNIFELCVRTRDAGDMGVRTVDLLELKLANNKKHSDEIILNTNEAFLWSLLDIASRTKNASLDFGGIDTLVKWNTETETFTVEAIDLSTEPQGNIDEEGNYRSPRTDSLYAIKNACVWPTTFLVSFKRQPQTSRYQKVKNIRGAKLVDYFTKKLNFTISSARLKFSGFQVTNVKGPPDRIIELVQTFYTSQMKMKLLTLLSATSIDEWKQLAGRDDGDKGFIEGDILRTAGNLTGKSAGFLVKKVGEGVGLGLTIGASEVGNGIQNMSEAIGIGAVGAGVNSAVSGIGDGVGSTVQGVGEGTSKLIKGAGKGVGQIVGGVGGGIMLTAKGVSKGVLDGDGKAVLSGFGHGFVSIGNGIAKGGESVVTGATDGVVAIGKGFFSGAMSVGNGLGRAVVGKQPERKNDSNRRDKSGSRKSNRDR